MPSFRDAVDFRRPICIFVVLLMAAIPGGCGGPGPGPSPTPEGQIGPGEPDTSGIPQLPSRGGLR